MADTQDHPATGGPSSSLGQPAGSRSLRDRLKQLESGYRSWADEHHVQYFGERPETEPAVVGAQPLTIDAEPARSIEASGAAFANSSNAIPTREPASTPPPAEDGAQQRSSVADTVLKATDAARPRRAAAEEMPSSPIKGSTAAAGERIAPAPMAAAAPIELPRAAAPIELPATEAKKPAEAPAAKAEERASEEGPARRRPDLTRRTRDGDFRQVLSRGLSAARANLISVFVFSLLLNALLLAMPIYLFQISDRVLTSRSLDTLIMLSIIVVGALLAHALLDVLRRVILMRVATDVECKLGAPVLAAAAKASQAGSSREFQTLGDLQHLRSFLTGPVILTMMDAPVSPLFLAAVFLIHWHLGVIVAGAGVALLLVTWLNQRVTAVPFGHAQAYAVRANLQTDAMARNAQAMNAMGMIPEGVQMWGRDTAESLKAQTIAQDRNILFTGLSKFIRLTTQIAILGWGAWLALNGNLTGGMLIAASIVASRALVPLEGTIEGWRSFIQARAAYGRIRALLQSSQLNFERLRLPRPLGRLTVERLLYVPPPTKKVILNGITFELNPGESLAIVGASGMGKSTLARMLVGSITPTAGNVRLDAMDLRNWDPRQFGESVGYLPQDVQLFPASIKANIARMREDADDEAIFDAAELADVHEMIAQFPQGYETMIAMDGSPLSGGQKQRIGLARAFFGNPRLVVLDEPNSNLDVAGERALATALTRAKSKGMTIVAITQRPSLLNSVDKIMILKDGTIQAMGPRDQMLAILNGRRPQDGAARAPLEPVIEG